MDPVTGGNNHDPQGDGQEKTKNDAHSGWEFGVLRDTHH